MWATWLLTVCWDDQPLGDLGVRQAAGDEREDLGLARRELVDRGRRLSLRAAGEALDQPPRHGRREQRPALGDDADADHELLLRRVLEQEPACPRAQRLVHVGVEVERREHEHGGPPVAAAVGARDRARGLGAVHLRHADVHQDDVGLQ
jgi:hypothetical protein